MRVRRYAAAAVFRPQANKVRGVPRQWLKRVRQVTAAVLLASVASGNGGHAAHMAQQRAMSKKET